MSSDVVFISVSNIGCIDLTLNHLESIKRAGMTNYVAYAIDSECYEVLKTKGYSVELIGREDFKDFHDFGGDIFNNLSFLRYRVIHKLLTENKTVWYLDVDTVVLRNLNQYVEVAKDSCDIALQDDINMPCTGCMLWFPSAIPLVRKMAMIKDTEYNDQIYLNAFLRGGNFKFGMFDRGVFPNGLLYFLEDTPPFEGIQKEFREFRKNRLSDIAFVHANWMIGLQTKIDALKSKGLWFLRSASENAESE